MKTTDTVDALVRAKIEEMGYMLDEVEFIKEHGDWVLTLYIDSTENPVTLDDCEKVSRAVEPMLDEADPIEQAYFLSVSSIGIDRPLKKDRDYERNVGAKVTVKLYAPIDKKKEFTGELMSFDAESFVIKAEPKGVEMTFKRQDVAMVRPYVDFTGLSE